MKQKVEDYDMLKIGLTGGIGTGKSFIADLFKVYGVKVVDCDIITRVLYSPHSELLKEMAQCFGAEILNADGSLRREQLRSIIFNDEQAKQKLNHIVGNRIIAALQEISAHIEQGHDFPKNYLLVEEQEQERKALAKKSLQKQEDDASFCHTHIPELFPLYATQKQLNGSHEQIVQAFSEPLEPSLVLQANEKPPYVIYDIPLLCEKELFYLVDRVLITSAEEQTRIMRIVLRDRTNIKDAQAIMQNQMDEALRCTYADDIIYTDSSNIEEKRHHVLNLHTKYLQLAQSTQKIEKNIH